jgi:macrolide-specific efflux system membrane fusion protein
LTIETAKVSLGYTQVLAPMDGVVVSIAVEEGQTVNANQTTPTILVLAQLDKMTIKAEISEGDVSRLKEGMDVDFTILGDSTHHYKTKLRSVDPAPTALVDNSNTDVNTLTDAIYYYGMMDVSNTNRKLKIGMTTEMTIMVNKVDNALTIPSAALGMKNKIGEYQVEVLNKDNTTNKRWVRIGVNNNINAEVISGLKENETVVVSQSTTITNTATQARAQARMSRMGVH